MESTMFKKMFLIFFCFFVNTVFALVPMEGIILGDLTPEQSADPLNFLFKKNKPKESIETVKGKQQLYRFIGFYREGRNLANFCDQKRTALFSSPWKKTQAFRSIYATLQYLGIDITLRAIAQYAKDLEYTKTQYENLQKKLIGGYCSKNITSISRKQLISNFMQKFERDEYFPLPSVEENTFFNSRVKKSAASKEGKEHEFALTIELFKSFCSWGNEVDNLRLMAPLVRDPYIMSFIFRQLEGKKLDWEYRKNHIIKTDSDDTIRIACVGEICRKRKKKDFERVAPRVLGSRDRSEDYGRMYCESLRDASYTYEDQLPKILNEIKARTLDLDQLLQNQFFALISTVPDFLINQSKFNDMLSISRSSIDEKFKSWSIEANERFSRDLLFEESLTIEKVDRSLYFSLFTPKFKVVFDVNLGEIDRATKINNKIKVKFPLKLSKSFLIYMRNEWNNRGVGRDKANKLIERFRLQIEDEVRNARSKFKIAPWEGDIEKIIIKEILEQITAYRGNFWKDLSSEEIQIPIEFNYGQFALKYINYRRKSMKNQLD